MVSASKHRKGFVYLGLLFAIALIGVALAGAGTLFSFSQKREREQELLKVGDTYRRAIGMYYEQTPGLVKQYPPTLEALLLDNRYITPRRYLRRIYPDPITGGGWGIVEGMGGGIMGVYSLTDAQPIKMTKFSDRDKLFDRIEHYDEWHFVYMPSI